MTEGAMHFSVKSIGLSGYGDRKKCTLLEAARHNLREIQAEHGVEGHIDPTRIHQNITMAGPSKATEVVALSAELAARAGVDLTKLRKDHCQAIELVFSLPPNTRINAPTYFAQCLQWAEVAFALPVLLATAHHDEAAKHLHVLLLPIKGGEHIGSKPLARDQTKKNRASFFEVVAGPAGLKRETAKLCGMVKRWAVAAALRECEAQGLPSAVGPLWPILRDAIRKDPTEALPLLHIGLESIRPRDADPPKPVATKPVGFQEAGAKPIGFSAKGSQLQNLSCVGFTPQQTSPDPQSVRRDAVHTGFQGQARRLARAVPKSFIANTVDGELTRVKDADFDPTVWAE